MTPISQKPEKFEAATLRLAALEAGKNNRSAAQEMVRRVLTQSPKYTAARVFDLKLQVIENKPDRVMELGNALVKDEPNTGAAAEA